MLRIPPLLAQSVGVAGIALATAWTWLALTRAQMLSPGAVLVCTIVFVAVALTVEAVVRRVRAGQPCRTQDGGPKGGRPMTIRVSCPVCRRPVAMTARGRLYKHGSPPCVRSRKPVGRIWPARWRGRRVQTIPGPDTWNPSTLEGAA